MRVCLIAVVCLGLGGCATAPSTDAGFGARWLGGFIAAFTSEPEQFRDNAEREQLALVAPQESIDPDDPRLREQQARKRGYYRSFEPLYPGLDYAAAPASAVED